MSKSSGQDGDYGITVNKWTNNSPNATIEKSFKTLNVEGFEIISEETDGNNHTMKINPNSHEVVIFKMDPRGEKFSASTQTLDVDLHGGNIPDDLSAIQRLSAISVKQPEVDLTSQNAGQAFNNLLINNLGYTEGGKQGQYDLNGPDKINPTPEPNPPVPPAPAPPVNPTPAPTPTPPVNPTP